MEVNPNIRAVADVRAFGPAPVRPAPKAQASQAAFADSEAVNRALQQAPDVRADQVAHATQLIGDERYPPLSTIRAIAHLLAINLSKEQG